MPSLQTHDSFSAAVLLGPPVRVSPSGSVAHWVRERLLVAQLATGSVFVDEDLDEMKRALVELLPDPGHCQLIIDPSASASLPASTRRAGRRWLIAHRRRFERVCFVIGDHPVLITAARASGPLLRLAGLPLTVAPTLEDALAGASV